MRVIAGVTERRGGWTLVELVTALIVLGVIATVVFAVLLEGMKTWGRARPTTELLYQAQLVSHRLRSDFRDLDGPGALLAMQPQLLRFQTEAGLGVEYQLVGTDLQRNGRLLAEGVGELRFIYSQTAGGIASTPTDVALLSADLRLDRAGLSTRIHTAVHPRRDEP